MKKLLVTTIFIAIFLGINAQDKFQPEWNVGVGGGPTFSSMSFVSFQ